MRASTGSALVKIMSSIRRPIGTKADDATASTKNWPSPNWPTCSSSIWSTVRKMVRMERAGEMVSARAPAGGGGGGGGGLLAACAVVAAGAGEGGMGGMGSSVAKRGLDVIVKWLLWPSSRVEAESSSDRVGQGAGATTDSADGAKSMAQSVVAPADSACGSAEWSAE